MLVVSKEDYILGLYALLVLFFSNDKAKHSGIVESL